MAAASVLVASSCSGGTTRRAAPTTAAPPTSVSLSASGPYTWNELSSPALTIGGGATSQLGAVAAPGATPGDPWLIAGTVIGSDGEPHATVWSSGDGLTWTAQPLSAGGEPSEAAGVTYWANRAVVVGAVGSGVAQRAAVWTSSAAGMPFGPVAVTPAFSDPAGAAMTLVAAGTLGLFAAGHAGTKQALWYSSDGTHWTRQTQAEQLLAGEPGAQIDALMVAPQGVFAAGSRLDGALRQAAMWTSSDASRWRNVRAPNAFTGPGERQIEGLATLSTPGAAAQGTELVAVGGIRSGATWSPVSWVSPDGSSWSQPSAAFPQAARARADPAGEQAEAVASAGTRLVAVGGGANQRVWTSADGRSWAEVALPAGAANAAGWRASLVASSGGTTVVADGVFGQPRVLTETASGWSEPSTNPAVFGPAEPVASPAALAQVDGRLLLAVDVTTPGAALGQESATVDFLASADGHAWQALPGSPVFSGAQLTGLAAGEPSGAVAVGGPAGALRADAWRSADGSTWSAAAEGPALPAGVSGPARTEGVARTGSGYVAVGEGTTAFGSTSAMAWTSTDGVTWQRGTPLGAPASARTADVAWGVCARAGQVVAVGAGDQPQDGRQALAWWSHDGAHWASGTVTPTAAPGAEERMDGCVALPSGAATQGQPTWVAYGQSTNSSGEVTPALWVSDNGAQWTEIGLPSVAGGPRGPVANVAIHGASWLAVGSAEQTGVWASKDSGRTWQRLDTSVPPWPTPAVGTASATQVAFVGADPVVAGQVDGQLAVWMGTPFS